MDRSQSKYFHTAAKMDEALISLLNEKEFEYITVKEICARAGVNRSTFYLHYENTRDLLEEAAGSLGATKLYTFFNVVIPNIKSGIASACIMSVINSFNNVSLSAFLTGPGVSMLPIEIMSYVEYHFDPTIAALATILMLATLGVMLLIEKTLGLQSVV